MNIYRTLLLVMLLSSIGIASAETGYLNATAGAGNSYAADAGTGTALNGVNWNSFKFDTSNYNYITSLEITLTTGFTFTIPQDAGTFTVVTSAGNTGSGTWAFDSTTKKLTYNFISTQIISSPVLLTLSKPIQISPTNFGNFFESGCDAVSSTKPILLLDVDNSGMCTNSGISAWSYISQTQKTFANFYNVTYAFGTVFVNISKDMTTINTKITISNETTQKYIEPTFNTMGFTYGYIYDNGLILRMEDSSGNYDLVTVNSSGISIPPVPGLTVTTDKTTYQRGNTIIISANNPSTSDVWLTAYGPTGIMTDILWNYKITAGTSQSISKVIQNDYPLGDYTINAATTQSYAPIVATTAFNISLPSNTSNALGLLWSSNIYNFGNTGLIYTQGNYNTTTLTITSPSLIAQSFSFSPNNTNTTGITLNENGQWKAYYVDNGNSSNNLTSYTRVALAGNFFSDNESYSSCTSAPNFVCWDQNTYYQGDSFVVDYKITKSAADLVIGYMNATIEVTNPYNTVVYTRQLNYSGIELFTSGSFTGSFASTAYPGIYIARIYTTPFPFYGSRDLRAEGETRLLASNASTVPTPTQPTQTDMTNTANGLFSLFTQIALYGLVIFVGIVYALVRMGVNGGALMVMSALIATFEALAGLFGGFGIYVILLTWIFAAVYFKFGRDMTTGGQ